MEKGKSAWELRTEICRLKKNTLITRPRRHDGTIFHSAYDMITIGE
jgi:hypothetical protein